MPMPADVEIWKDHRQLPSAEMLAEDDLMLEAVAAGTRPATLRFWTMPDVVVCPVSMRRKWEVAGPYHPAPLFRSTGGGVVAVEKGVSFWSLAWATPREEAASIDEAYFRLATMMESVLELAGVPADVAEVPEAMCRGRYDIAINGQKIAGLSQRRIERGPKEARISAFLVHAFVLENADVSSVEERCNSLAAHMGVEGTEPGALISLHTYLGHPVSLESWL